MVFRLTLRIIWSGTGATRLAIESLGARIRAITVVLRNGCLPGLLCTSRTRESPTHNPSLMWWE